MKLPGPDHPITIVPNPKRVVIRFGTRTLADTARALTLQEASYSPVFYIPRADVDMSALSRTDHATHCPYKGDASYYSVVTDDREALNAVWTYENPFPAMDAIREYLAFYPNRVDSIQEL
jgi:uncharacterized protein (DUF427 family)